ncbi:hypothetical protein OM428_04455 [Enterococcus gallinarum]|nr:hypothetical protein [Enterococcus gallinarum]MCW3744387.1 hypothetical protein [Enterococcus gallinarum]
MVTIDCFDKDQALPAKYWQSAEEKCQLQQLNGARAAFYLGFSKKCAKRTEYRSKPIKY